MQQLLPGGALSWITNLIQAFAWPASAVLIASMFRGEVRQVLERLVRLKFQNFEAQFRRDLHDSEELALPAAPRRLLDLPPGSRRLLHEVDAPATPIARPSGRRPGAVIEDAWSELSEAADRAAGTVGVDPIRPLVERGLLTGSSLLLFERLRQLRGQINLRVDWEPAAADAERFAELARPLADRLRQAAAIEGGPK